MLAVGEVLACVVDDVISAERSDQIDLRGTANRGDFGAEGFRDLYCEGAYASRRTDDPSQVP